MVASHFVDIKPRNGKETDAGVEEFHNLWPLTNGRFEVNHDSKKKIYKKPETTEGRSHRAVVTVSEECFLSELMFVLFMYGTRRSASLFMSRFSHPSLCDKFFPKLALIILFLIFLFDNMFWKNTKSSISEHVSGSNFRSIQIRNKICPIEAFFDN